MNNKLFGIYGASGFGREVMPLAREQLKKNNIKLVFVDDASLTKNLNGHDVFTYQQFLDSPEKEKSIAIAIADSRVRERLMVRCVNDGVGIFNIVASNVVVMDDVDLSDGYIISPFVTITSNVRIGTSFHANIYSYVAHDCVIGNSVTLAPGVKCNGNVVVEDYVYIGTGAIIKQGSPGKPLRIGKGAIVGMGAVVTKDVPAGAVVVGNPARPLER